MKLRERLKILDRKSIRRFALTFGSPHQRSILQTFESAQAID